MPSLQTFTFRVEDDAREQHDVTVVRHGPGHLSAHCTCPAGRNDEYCAHTLRLLAGDGSQLVSDNALEVEVLEWWVACLDLKRTIARVLHAQSSGAMPPSSVAEVFAHWPDLTAREMVGSPSGSPSAVRGVA